MNPHHGSGCGISRAVVVWLLSFWIEFKDLQGTFLLKDLHLTQSEPGKIDPMCTPDPCEGATQSPRNPLKHCPQAASSSQCLIYELGM